LAALSLSLSGVYLPEPRMGCFDWRSSGYGRGAVGGAVGGAGNEGIGGGREKAGWVELPAESVRGGGLMPLRSFCILRGPTVGVAGPSDGRRKSSSSGRPCLRLSMADRCDYVYLQLQLVDHPRWRTATYFWVRARVSSHLTLRKPWGEGGGSRGSSWIGMTLMTGDVHAT
jgi:hypothetical protein